MKKYEHGPRIDRKALNKAAAYATILGLAASGTAQAKANTHPTKESSLTAVSQKANQYVSEGKPLPTADGTLFFTYKSTNPYDGQPELSKNKIINPYIEPLDPKLNPKDFKLEGKDKEIDTRFSFGFNVLEGSEPNTTFIKYNPSEMSFVPASNAKHSSVSIRYVSYPKNTLGQIDFELPMMPNGTPYSDEVFALSIPANSHNYSETPPQA